MKYLLKKKLNFNLIFCNYFFLIIFFIVIFLPLTYVYGALSCSITTSGACSGVVLLRMSSSTNAHAELPGQSTGVYDDNVVCCTGVTGLGNSCADNYEVIVRLSGTTGTNAHVEEKDQTNINYNNQKACISSSFAGDEITIGYQATNCTGYDTTLFSMSNTPTNSMVGGPSAYNNKVCADIFSQTISFSISNNSIGFGNLMSTGLRYATADGTGSSSEVESHSLSVNTNAPSGYIVMVKGGAPENNLTIIDPIGGTNMTPTPGTNAFGIRAVASGGVGYVVSPYDGSGFAYDADDELFTTIAEATTGDGNTTNYSVRSVATIDSLLDPGEYTTDLTYVVTANF